jgi:hypothetical protein
MFLHDHFGYFLHLPFLPIFQTFLSVVFSFWWHISSSSSFFQKVKVIFVYSLQVFVLPNLGPEAHIMEKNTVQKRVLGKKKGFIL